MICCFKDNVWPLLFFLENNIYLSTFHFRWADGLVRVQVVGVVIVDAVESRVQVVGVVVDFRSSRQRNFWVARSSYSGTTLRWRGFRRDIVDWLRLQIEKRQLMD